MNTVEYDRMAEREQSYWWHIGRLRIIGTYLRLSAPKTKQRHILNVGCGTGGTVPLLESFGTVENVDVAPEAIAYMQQRGYTRVKLFDGQTLPAKPATYDTVVAFDVLEHIAEDVEALREWSRVLKPGGRIVVTVPAYQWLWSQHDVSLHHKRRYTRRSLARTVHEAGLEIEKSSYAIVFSFPVVVLFRALRSLSRKQVTAETSYVATPSLVSALAVKLLTAEATLHSYITFPFGTSVVAVIKQSEK